MANITAKDVAELRAKTYRGHEILYVVFFFRAYCTKWQIVVSVKTYEISLFNIFVRYDT